MWFAFVGRNGSGKSIAIDYLKQKGFKAFSLSDELRAILSAQGKSHDRDTMTNTGNMLRATQGNNYFAQLVLKKLEEHKIKNAVIDSIRHPSEIQILKTTHPCVLVFLDVPQEERFARVKGREDRGDTSSFAVFVTKDNAEWDGKQNSQDIKKTAEMADEVIANTGSLANFYKQLDALVSHYDTQ